MSVEQNLEQILSARYGKDVRQSIHDAIYDINEVAKDAEYHASTAPTSAQAYANAALAAEQAAQQAKQDAEAAAEQAMSGTPTGYEQLVSDVYSLETKEDTVLADTPTFTGRVLLDKMYGMSIQDGTPTPSVPVAINSAKANFQNGGKNLINLDLSILQALNTLGTWSGRTYTRNNISFTINTDGTVSVRTTNDGASGGASLILISNHSVSGYIIGKNYTIKGCPSGGSGSTYCLALNYRRGSSDNVHAVEDYGSGANKTFENTFDVFYPYIWVGSGTVITTPKVFNPMLCLSDFEDKTFNIFKGKQSVTADLVLRAIEVTSSDDYNLVKDGKYYIADTLEKIDGGYQITRRTSYITFNGTESWDMSGTIGSSDNPRRYSLPPQYWAQNVMMSGNARIGSLSDKFAFVVQNNVEWGNFNIAWNGYFLFYDKNGNFNSKSEFLAWLSSNAPSFLVPIITPTVETVSNADAKKLLSLKSYDEATYVAQTEDTEGVMVLEYGKTNYATKALSGYVEAEQNSIRLDDLEA